MADHSPEPGAPGWYDDPEGRNGMERYWNGSTWSGAPRSKPPSLEWSGIATIVVGTILFSALAWWLFIGF